MELPTEFWIGTALSIPLSIIASLLAPKVQTYLDTRSKVAALKRSEELTKELQRISEFKNNSDLLREYLLEVLIRAAYYLAITGIIAGPLWAASSILYLGGMLNAAGQFVSLIGALLVVRISSRAIRDLDRVRNFNEFELQVGEYLKKPNAA
jgi:hypothetical protein